MRDPRYDVLFEPVQIGPVTAPNRFYQVPRCTGRGWRHPRGLAAFRGVKAEGGWGVVCTEYCSIHPSSDDDPLPYAALWDAADVRAGPDWVAGPRRTFADRSRTRQLWIAWGRRRQGLRKRRQERLKTTTMTLFVANERKVSQNYPN